MARSVKTTDLRTIKVVPYLQEQQIDDWYDIYHECDDWVRHYIA